MKYAWVCIIKELCKNDLNVSKTARSMNYHRNSLCYHINDIKAETGYDPRTFYGATALLKMIEEDSHDQSQV